MRNLNKSYSRPNFGLFQILLAFCLIVFCPGHAEADTRSDAHIAMEMWQPSTVRFEDGQLIVVLPQDRVTEEMYISVLSFGLCVGHLSGKDFSSVLELVVLNRFMQQGYVYERGVSDCEVVTGEASSRYGNTKLHILSATHLY